LVFQVFTFLGDLMMRFLEEIKRWLGEVTEILLLLIAVGIAVEILFGSAVPFFGGIVANLTALLNTLGEKLFFTCFTEKKLLCRVIPVCHLRKCHRLAFS
jgi:hypothetical protein